MWSTVCSRCSIRKKKWSSLPEACNVNTQDILELGIISHLATNNDLCLPLPIVLIAEALLIAKLWGRCCQFGPYTKQVELHLRHVSPCPDTVQSALLLCIQHGNPCGSMEEVLALQTLSVSPCCPSLFRTLLDRLGWALVVRRLKSF